MGAANEARTTRARPGRRSAGLLLYRGASPGAGLAGLEVLIVHPGGPIWAKRDVGAWSIPKGEHGSEEEPLAAARREFAEELGIPAPDGEPLDLGEIRQRSGKVVRAWALAGDLDVTAVCSNTFALEWPPRSGAIREFPEVDRAAWFAPDAARVKLNPAQAPLIDRLADMLEMSTR